MITPASALGWVRQRRPFVDHLVRAYSRYTADAGDRLAAAVTFYWFLSLFPILLVAVWVTSLILGDAAGQEVTSGLGNALPEELAKTIGDVVTNNAGQAGALGLVGLLFSGLGWINGLRGAIRAIWHHPPISGNIVMTKLVDALTLVGLFAVIGASVVASAVATAATGNVLDALGLNQTSGVTALTKALGYALGGAVDTAVFLYLFRRLARVHTSLGRVVKGALFGAVGFEILKVAGAFYVTRTTTKGEATYGTFAVVVGLLLFLNLISRLILLAAAFTVTAPYDSDVVPSGTAGGPLTNPVQFSITAQHPPDPEGVTVTERSWAPHAEAPPPVVQLSAAAERQAELLPGAPKVQLAARATAGVVGLMVAAVGVYGLRTVVRLVRR